MNAAFFDTNIVFYAAQSDCDEPHKRDYARQLLQTRNITTSTQVMMEIYSALRRNLHYGPDEAQFWVETLKEENVVTLSANDVSEAIRMARRFELSQWDSLILRAAGNAGLDIVYSEDMSHGETYGSVRVCNPFVEDFLDAA